MIYIVNAFSFQMLDSNKSVGQINYNEVSADTFELEIKPALAAGEAVSAIGHPDTAAVLGVPMNRCSVKLAEGDSLCLCQLMGGRLPEGATTLPEGFSFKYFMVHVKYGL